MCHLNPFAILNCGLIFHARLLIFTGLLKNRSNFCTPWSNRTTITSFSRFQVFYLLSSSVKCNVKRFEWLYLVISPNALLAQVPGVALSHMQADLLDHQGSLFSAQLELQGLQRAQQQGQRREEDLARANQRLQTDLQRALQHHQEGERHNHDLQAALEKTRLEVQQMEEKWRDEWRQREKEVEERERTIRELKTSLEHKERLIEVRHATDILIISPGISTDRRSIVC